jgi:hypothetical protein
MKETKIQLSDAEIDLMCDASIILTKNKILQQVKALLLEVQEDMVQSSLKIGENTIFNIAPKISKGENYLGLPYLVLDYPRVFNHSGTFAIRSMFWWGHYFSSTLHLSGHYTHAFGSRIQNAYQQLAALDYYIGIHTDPWQHHFGESNYCKISGLSEADFHLYCRQEHIKIAAKWPLMDWSFAANHLFISWKMFLQLCF